jgi:predicted metal-dependent hydrolase
MPAPELCARCQDEPNELLLRGIDLFNRRAYFECHEVLEDAWNVELGRKPAPYPLVRAPDGRCANLYKGILQVGVGCYHLLRGNYRGAMIKLQSGADYLEPFAPVCMGVDVARLIAAARRLRTAVVAVGPDATASVDRALLPIIRMVDATSEPPTGE